MENNKNNCSSIIGSLLEGMDKILESKTVVGEPTRIDDTIIIPMVDVSFGVGAGASLSQDPKTKCAGGGGLSGKISPNSVLVIKNGVTKVVSIKNQDTISKVMDAVPEIIDKIGEIVNRKDMPSDDEALKAAFPEEE